ncbi:MAG: FeoB-associated Cys-rich membrane protein [Eubacteriales bacterium]
MVDIITIAVVILILTAALYYVLKAKKKGVQCIGCSQCNSCKNCHKEKDET